MDQKKEHLIKLSKILNSRQHLNQILVINPEEPYVNFLLAQTCNSEEE